MSLHDLYELYHDRVKFLVVYIREAHPVDGWWLGSGLLGLLMKRKYTVITDVYDPKTIQERRVVAGRCEETLRYGIETYVDGMDDGVSKAYAAMSTRLYLIGLDGRVVYTGGLGPFGFKPNELKSAIDEYLTRLNTVNDNHLHTTQHYIKG